MKKRRNVRFVFRCISFALIIAISSSAAPIAASAVSGGVVAIKTLPPGTLQVEREVYILINMEREKEGLPPLKWDSELAAVARAHSRDMERKDYFSHTNLDGQSPSARMRTGNISFVYAGENLARGHKTPEAVVEAWMKSEGHRDAILSGKATHIGVGFENYYWTVDMIG